MEKYDVVIVGGGPAGLICAEHLTDSNLSVLLLEKDKIFGDKICAGGITRKGLSIFDFPDEIIQHRVLDTALHSAKRYSYASAPEPIVVTVDRKAFGEWQRNRLNGTTIEVKNNSRVVEVRKESVILDNNEEIGYKHLVGADGYNSIVRRFLGLPQEKVLIGIQYMVSIPGLEPKLEIFLNNKYFNAWYGWKFPHKDLLCVGSCCDPKMWSSKKLRDRLHEWLGKEGIDVSGARYESAPISYDYRGLKFENIFLVGDAAGMASGLTGEGIYQSLISGIEVADYIKGRNEESDEMKFVVRYNRIQYKTLRAFRLLGPLRPLVYEIFIMLMNNKWVKNKVNKGFS